MQTPPSALVVTPRSPRNAGFTLIELLVVISIIALLIGILLPALGAARHSARVIGCATQMQQIGRAIETYMVDADGYYPLSSTNLANGGPTNNHTWDDALGLGGYDGRSRDSVVVPGNTSITAVPYEVYECPLDNLDRQTAAAHPRSYGMSELRLALGNGSIVPGYPGVTGGLNGSAPASIRVDAVTAGSDAIVLGENLQFNAGAGISLNVLGRNQAAEVHGFLHAPEDPPGNGAADSIAHHKANGGGEFTAAPDSEAYVPNYLFADGHVASQDAELTFENADNFVGGNFRNSQWDARPGAN